MKTIDLSRGSVLVTGGGGSIGGAIAREAARAGAEVAVCDYSVSDAQQAVAEIESEGGRALAIEVDVTSTESLEHAVTTAATNLGPLIGLVTAAGILRTGSVNSQDLESWRELMAVNVDGTFLAIQAAQNHLERNQGAIVTLGSVSAHIGSEDGIAYTTSKGAVHSMTYATAGNLAPKGIRVNSVCPGWVDGGFTHRAMATMDDPESLRDTARQMHYLGRMATPEDVANAAVWLLSDHAAFVTGTCLYVDGGYMIKRG